MGNHGKYWGLIEMGIKLRKWVKRSRIGVKRLTRSVNEPQSMVENLQSSRGWFFFMGDEWKYNVKRLERAHMKMQPQWMRCQTMIIPMNIPIPSYANPIKLWLAGKVPHFEFSKMVYQFKCQLYSRMLSYFPIFPLRSIFHGDFLTPRWGPLMGLSTKKHCWGGLAL